MKSIKFLSLLASITILHFQTAIAQPTISDKPLSPRIANYQMNVKLNPKTKIINGSEVLTWNNTSTDTIKELRFHMYLNAFKNTKSTFYKEGGHRFRGENIRAKDTVDWGWIKIKSMKDVNGSELKNKIRFIHPDDNNKDDRTVIKVDLNNPVLPGSTIVLNIQFQTKLPKIVARSGFSRDYFLIAQWFPKIGVYEVPGQRFATKGSWNCHQYHANSEFYADFGNYDVSITLPKEYIVGATGLNTNTKLNTDGTKTVNYLAEDVVDFAWTAFKHYKVVETQWKHVHIKALLQPNHFYMKDRFIGSLINALNYFNDNLGIYPYTTVTLVDPPYYALAASGMEYPTFFTTMALWGIPEGLKMIEDVTIHEFGHNYFMGLLATNEFEEAWMDEGFNTYYETRIMNYYYGKKTSMFNLFGFHFGDFEMQREGYTGMSNPKAAPDASFAWQYPEGNYGRITYNKTATWMTTLERLVGLKTMNKIMKTYFEKWKFKHPTGRDFINVVNGIMFEKNDKYLGNNMNWFFDQVLYGTGVCDYKLGRIRVIKIEKPRGIFDDSLSLVNNDSINSKREKFKSSVFVERLGGVKIPVEILVHFSNGSEELERWNGKGRVKVFDFVKPSKAVWAKVDPFNKLPIDINITNNSLNTRPRTSVIWKYTSKVLFWLENSMLLFSTLF